MEPWALEVMGSLEVMELDCFLVFLSEETPTLKLKRSEPKARVLPIHPSGEQLLEVLDQYLEKKSRRERFRSYRVIDYLLAAGLGSCSLNLHLVFRDGQDAMFEVFDGCPWNAYYGDQVGLTALELALHRQVQWTTIRSRSVPPSSRQCEFPWTALFDPVSLASPLFDPRATRDLGTQPIQMAQAEGPSFPPPVAKEADGTVHRFLTRYDRAIDRGIRAALTRDYSTARKSFEEALGERPQDPLASFNLRRLPGAST
ncbi:MAG: hypothetical protein KDD47_14205 [Acidobacteria bacterium]|nr:hypothetical protein [Acidobacteriota bacterium]